MGSVNPKIFRAYDIRGTYPQDLNEKTAYKIGRSFAVYLKESEAIAPEKIAVGQDARLSSPVICRSFISGVTDEGINVWDIGLIPVDVIYFASGYFHIPAVMITASHNPKDWNGLKLMKSNVEFFPVKELEAIINSDAPVGAPTLWRRGSGAPEIIASLKKGKITIEDIKTDYLKHVLSFINVETIRPMRVVVDASNGAVGPVLEAILKKLPIEYTALNFSPDGDFPAHEPDPTNEKNITDLKNEIIVGHYHFGCAFDSDGDRIIFVDENGKSILSSTVAALISKYFLLGTRGEKVVYSATIGKIVPEVVRIYNGEAVRERVGHTFISRRLKEINGIFGAEKSGHYFFRKNFYADSGVISFLIMLDILSNGKKALSTLVSQFGKYVSTPEINFKIKEPENFIKKIAQNFEGYEINWLDGLTVTTSDFWFNMRPSNTEPLLRLNIEAKDEIILNRVKKDLIGLIKMGSSDF